MLRFFRRIRKTLLDKGNFKRYLVYAVGEILLVMIGILLALQVNNWNQKRNDGKAEQQFYREIKRDLIEDRGIIEGNATYNQRYLEQYRFATEIIEGNNSDRLDTLVKITMDLTKYSDFHRESNIYATMVNSGDIKLLKNAAIVERLQRLDERYVYINQLEDSHVEIIRLYVIPFIVNSIKVKTLTALNSELFFTPEVQNYFTLFDALMLEKDQLYQRSADEINAILVLIDEELGTNNNQGL